MKLNRSIIYFDLETTGLDLVEDRIVEIYALKVNVDGSEERLYHLINPERPVSPDAFELHGYSNELLSQYPTFNELSDIIFDFFDGCDLAGFNVFRFDIPVLTEALLNSGKKYNAFKYNIIDGYKIYTKFEDCTLSGLYKKYFGDSVDSDKTHGAEYDVNITRDVINKQFELHNLVDVESVSTLLRTNKDGHKMIDTLNVFTAYEGAYYYGSGKWKGKLVSDHMDYLDWVTNKSSYAGTVKIIGNLIRAKIKKKI